MLDFYEICILKNKSKMLIMNTLIGIDDLDRKLEISKIWSQN